MDERDPGLDIRVLFTLEHIIRDAGPRPGGEGRTISRRMLYVEIDADGSAPPPARALPRLSPARGRRTGRGRRSCPTRMCLDYPALEETARRETIAHVVPEHVTEVRDRRMAWIDKTRAAVKDRLTKEIAYWDHRADRLKQKEQAGKAGARLNSGEAWRRLPRPDNPHRRRVVSGLGFPTRPERARPSARQPSSAGPGRGPKPRTTISRLTGLPSRRWRGRA